MGNAPHSDRHLLRSIQQLLNSPRLRENLEALFIEVLHWGNPQAGIQLLQVGAPINRTLTLVPIAQLGQVPVYRHDWEGDRLPNLTERRAVNRALKPVAVEHLLCYVTADGQQVSFVWARPRGRRQDKGPKVGLRSLSYEVGSPARTTIERLAKLAFAYDDFDMFGEPQVGAVTNKLNAAFDVEAVTREFFRRYREAFQQVEQQITGIVGDDLRLFTQKLFNRLLFIVFLERKRWLSFQGRRDYLRALWQDHQAERASDPTLDFYYGRLHPLFFAGLNTQHEVDLTGINRGGFPATRIGQVPYLNGGLFEQAEDDRDSGIIVPDEVLGFAINELFYRFNFTVTESTPLDIEVAIDPEMLGKIFERLVTGRHETGSYYTPKPVVAFMGREGLKGYLQSLCPQESPTALNRFVDAHDPVGLVNPEVVLNALRTVKVCDPACGSGAYLLGMLRELLDLRACLFATRGLDPLTTYERKLEIIQQNLYGVDLDRFGVNIARLRLWLSLVIDFEGDNPPPLPNLDLKIEDSDSLTAPDPSGGLQPDLFRQRQIQDLFQLKADYMVAHGAVKLDIRRRIEELCAQVAAWAHPGSDVGGFDWVVEFAEVFALNGGKGGFDIVLANPPYVRADAQYRHIQDEEERQETIARWKRYRKALKTGKTYETLYEKWDLYIPFLERAWQLLCPGGQMVFIISDAYNAAKYADKSHEFFLNRSRVERLDFCSEIPLFEAGINNTILHFTRINLDDEHTPLRFRRWGDKSDDFEDNVEMLPTALQAEIGPRLFRPDWEPPPPISVETVELDRVCYISKGMVIHADERHHLGAFKTQELVSLSWDRLHPKPFVQGKDLAKWVPERIRYLEWGTARAPSRFSRPTFPELHEPREKLIAVRTPGPVPKVIYDCGGLHFDASSVGFVPWHYLGGVVNRSVSKTARYRYQSPEGDRKERERLSRRFHPKYLLAIMNSSFAREWLARVRRSKRHVYPNDWKKLPIAPISMEEQEELIRLVNAILAEFKQYGFPLPDGTAARVAELEREIDERVAELYGM